MGDDTTHTQLAAYLLSVLVRHDREIRAIGPPRSRQEWGIGRIGDYLRAIGRETIMEGGEAELWALLRESVALLPSRREEASLRLIRLWRPLVGWLDDQDIPVPVKPPNTDCRPLDEEEGRVWATGPNAQRPAWLVIAMDGGCCGKVQLSIFGGEVVPADPTTWQSGWDDTDPAGEVVMIGLDWRDILTKAATERARRSGIPICAQCSVVFVKDDNERQEIENGAIRLLHALIDERASVPIQSASEPWS